MPLKTKCPGCNKALVVPETVIGKRVKCPACSHTWQIAQPIPVAEAIPDPPPEPPKKNEWFDEMMGDEYPIEAIKKGPASPASPFASGSDAG